MSQVIAILSTSSGFARSFQDEKLTAELQEEKQSKGLRVRNEIFPDPLDGVVPRPKKVSPEVAAIRANIRALLLPISLKNKAQSWHRDLATLPTRVKGEGLLPDNAKVQRWYDDNMGIFKQKIADAKPDAIRALPECIAYARSVKGAEFVQEKYPTARDIEEIDISWSYRPLTSVDSKEFEQFLSAMDENRANQIRNDALSKERERNRLAMFELCQRNVRALDALVKQLSNPDAKFYESVYNTVVEQISLTEQQNIASNLGVSQSVEEVKALLATVNVEQLKKNAGMKVQLGDTLKAMSARFSSIGVRNFGDNTVQAPQ
jgi:hypothetical protein